MVMYSRCVRSLHGEEKVKSLFQQINSDGYGPIEFACQSGDVNCVEFCIRRGLNPFKMNTKTQETCLHIAIKSHRIEVTRFLLDIGCDLTIKDQSGYTPLTLPQLTQDGSLYKMVFSHSAVSLSGCGLCLISQNERTLLDNTGSIKTVDQHMNSYAIYRNNPSRFDYCFIYAIVVFFTLVLSITIPFWIWIPGVIGLSAGYWYVLSVCYAMSLITNYMYRYLSTQISNMQKRASHANGRLILLWWQVSIFNDKLIHIIYEMCCWMLLMN